MESPSGCRGEIIIYRRRKSTKQTSQDTKNVQLDVTSPQADTKLRNDGPVSQPDKEAFSFTPATISLEAAIEKISIANARRTMWKQCVHAREYAPIRASDAQGGSEQFVFTKEERAKVWKSLIMDASHSSTGSAKSLPNSGPSPSRALSKSDLKNEISAPDQDIGRDKTTRGCPPGFGPPRPHLKYSATELKEINGGLTSDSRKLDDSVRIELQRKGIYHPRSKSASTWP